MRGSVTAQWSNVQTSSSATNWGKLQWRPVKCLCRRSGGKLWAENVFTLSRRKGNDYDEPRSGRPSTSRTPQTIEKVRQMLAQEGGHQRCTFSGRECYQKSVTAFVRSIPQDAFAACFRKLYERCQSRVLADGDYFERQYRKFVF